MSVELRLPNINGTTMQQQMAQTKSYLYQLTQQLNWALSTIEAGASSESITVQGSGGSTHKLSTAEEAEASFSELKSLIIKSADIVNAYYETFQQRMEGLYVASSDFGTYKQETALTIEENAEAIRQNYENNQQISLNLTTGLAELREDVTALQEAQTNAWIKTGLLAEAEDGTPIYGVEVGQKNTVDGVEVFNRFARFAADKLSFYNANGDEVAYISYYQMVITSLKVTGEVVLKEFILDQTDGLALKHIGG